MAWQSGFLAPNGVQLHYRQSTGAQPTLVLVHGMTDDQGYWARVTQALEGGYGLLVYDMRGHGLSDAPETGYTPDDYASDLLGLVAALGIDRPVVIGHSLGAATAAAAAARASEKLRGVVLEDPPWNMPTGNTDPGPALAFAEAWRISNAELQALDHAGRVARCQAEHPDWIEQECVMWAESKRMVREQIFSGFIPLMTQPWQLLVPQISCPTLLITGEIRLGGLVSETVASEFIRLAPRGTVQHIPNAGHGIHREQLEAYVAAIREFVASVSRG